MSEPFIDKQSMLNELSNVNREKHKRKSHRVYRRDREPSRIPIRSFKSRNKSRKVREFVYARNLSCIHAIYIVLLFMIKFGYNACCHWLKERAQ